MSFKSPLFDDIKEMGKILEDLKDWVNTYPNHKVSNYHIQSQNDFYQKIILLIGGQEIDNQNDKLIKWYINLSFYQLKVS